MADNPNPTLSSDHHARHPSPFSSLQSIRPSSSVIRRQVAALWQRTSTRTLQPWGSSFSPYHGIRVSTGGSHGDLGSSFSEKKPLSLYLQCGRLWHVHILTLRKGLPSGPFFGNVTVYGLAGPAGPSIQEFMAVTVPETFTMVGVISSEHDQPPFGQVSPAPSVVPLVVLMETLAETPALTISSSSRPMSRPTSIVTPTE